MDSGYVLFARVLLGRVFSFGMVCHNTKPFLNADDATTATARKKTKKVVQKIVNKLKKVCLLLRNLLLRFFCEDI